MKIFNQLTESVACYKKINADVHFPNLPSYPLYVFLSEKEDTIFKYVFLLQKLAIVNIMKYW